MRVHSEIMKLSNKYRNVMIERGEKNEIILNIDKRRLIIPSNYPHYPPQIFINDIPFEEYITPPSNTLKSISINFAKRMESNIFEKSITSFIHWKPSLSLSNIFDEIDQINKIKQYTKYMIAIHLTTEKFNFPIELKQEIFTFLLGLHLCSFLV
jgi:hypothetical protein